MQTVDTIVIGQGLAGTAVAWWLLWSGERVVVLDREEAVTSSRVAAGLVTPITGQRFVKSWKWDHFWETAVTYYRRVEAELDIDCFRITPMVRFLTSPEEVARFHQRCLDPAFEQLVQTTIHPVIELTDCQQPHGGFVMPVTGQLDVSAYLMASRARFQATDSYRTASLDLMHDLEVTPTGVRLPRLQLAARSLIFCEGIGAQGNPWFSKVTFKPAKGEILTVRIPGWNEDRVLHRGIWIAPTRGGDYRVGATYEWKQLDHQPTEAARDELEARLRECLRRPYEVIAQAAAIRPIHQHQYPVLGLHPDVPQLGYLNGLGSKGTLQAPRCAQQLVSLFRGEGRSDAESDLHRWTDCRGCHP